MNYGKNALDKKLKSASSKTRKLTNMVLFGFLKTLLLLALVCMGAGVSAGIGMVKGIIDSAPEINIESIVPQGFATTVYDSAGNLTDTLVTAGSNRDPVTYEELPEDLINAFVAIEDSRFWVHNGIDLRSIMRAAKGILTGDSSAGGGSTITQQLAKNLYFTHEKELPRKVAEVLVARELERTYTKNEILELYVNSIYFGDGYYTAGDASRG